LTDVSLPTDNGGGNKRYQLYCLHAVLIAVLKRHLTIVLICKIQCSIG